MEIQNIALFLLLALVLLAFWPHLATLYYNRSKKLVYDSFTRLYKARVGRVYYPTSTHDLSNVLEQNWNGLKRPVCIRGGGFSMGLQALLWNPNSLLICTDNMSSISEFDPVQKTVLVGSGVKWRQLQKYLTPKGFAVKTMQSYNNFAVGGSIGVNCHGRYVNLGPIGLTVRSLKVVLYDGSVRYCSREQNPELFSAVIGGYGLIAVIAEARLELAEDESLVREVKVIGLQDYLADFFTRVKNSNIVFHNGDILFEGNQVRVTDYLPLKNVTPNPKLQSLKKLYLLERLIIRLFTSLPRGITFKQNFLDPLLCKPGIQTTRAEEASYCAESLNPTSKLFRTYVLQEYFVSKDNFLTFALALLKVLKEEKVNVVNVSIRHAVKDDVSALPWARFEDTFCFVLYYKQGTSKKAQRKVGEWTRKLVNLVIENGGTYYLPYQPHLTEAQFESAYALHVGKFRNLMRKYNPHNILTSGFGRKYLQGNKES